MTWLVRFRNVSAAGLAALLLAFSEPGRFKAVVWIGADGLVERVDSVQFNPVLGDTPSATVCSGYRDHAGVKFSSRIRQNQGGFAVLELEVKAVLPHAPAGVGEVPGLVSAFTERVTVEKAAEGVWCLAGGSHNSVLIEMRDHLILVESPLYDGRALAVLAEARKLAGTHPAVARPHRAPVGALHGRGAQALRVQTGARVRRRSR